MTPLEASPDPLRESPPNRFLENCDLNAVWNPLRLRPGGPQVLWWNAAARRRSTRINPGRPEISTPNAPLESHALLESELAFENPVNDGLGPGPI